MNLCTNAAHAMKEKGGILKVSLEETFMQAGDKGKALLPGKYLRLSVGDTGHGMDESVSERIFEPFFTTKDRSEGTGMGLSVVHGIVANYGGTIDVETEVGKGTVFHVFFPEAEQANVREPVKPAGELPGGEEQILVVDDEKPMVDSLVSMLTHLGYQVTSRTSSIEALEAFRAQPDEFDLVITDQTMPNIRGDELAEKLIGMRSDIPIILCTGFSESISQEQAKALGYDSTNEYVYQLIMREQERVSQQERIESLLLEGLDSGDPIEATDNWWEHRRTNLWTSNIA
jgi:CheY-like chemotaxis protein